MSSISDAIKKLTPDQKDELLACMFDSVIRSDTNSIAILTALKINNPSVYESVNNTSKEYHKAKLENIKTDYPNLKNFIEEVIKNRPTN